MKLEVESSIFVALVVLGELLGVTHGIHSYFAMPYSISAFFGSFWSNLDDAISKPIGFSKRVDASFLAQPTNLSNTEMMIS